MKHEKKNNHCVSEQSLDASSSISQYFAGENPVVFVDYGKFDKDHANDFAKVSEQLEITIQVLLNKGYGVILYPVMQDDIVICHAFARRFMDTRVVVISEMLDSNEISDILRQSCFAIHTNYRKGLQSVAAETPFVLILSDTEKVDILANPELENRVLRIQEVNAGKILKIMEETKQDKHSNINTGNDLVETEHCGSNKQMNQCREQVKRNIQILIEKGHFLDAQKVLVEYKQFVQDDDVDLYSMEAIIAIMENRLDDAKQILVAGLKLENQNFDLLYNLAYVYQLLGNDQKALVLYDIARKLAPNLEIEGQVIGMQQQLEMQVKEMAIAECLTSIVILTYNNLDYTKLCIDSIRRYTEPGMYEIIVIDNCSIDGTVEWLKEQPDLRVIYNKENFGFPKGCNQGIGIARGDSVLLLNNDTIVTPNWLTNLCRCLYSTDEIGAVGAVTNSCSNYQSIPYPYESIDQMLVFASKYNNCDTTKWEERLRLVGFCMLMKREVIEKIGLLDEIFTPGNFEDDDYSLRIRQAGYRLILCKDTFIHHFGSASFGKVVGKHNDLLIRNRKKFQDKWGFDPYYIIDVRKAVTAFLKDKSISPLHVLEIGCAAGGTLLDIRNSLPEAKLFGLEECPKCVVNPEHFAEIKIGDIKAIRSYSPKSFDAIILSDLDQGSITKNVKLVTEYLKDNGDLILIVPQRHNHEVSQIKKQVKKAYSHLGCEEHVVNNEILLFYSAKERAILHNDRLIEHRNSLSSIIVRGYGATYDIKSLINSVREYTEAGSYEIIVVDNGLKSTEIEWLQSQNDIKKIINNITGSIASGLNRAIRIAEGDTVVFLDNVVVMANWLSNLKQCLYSADIIAAVGPVTNFSEYYQTIETKCTNYDEEVKFAIKYNKTDSTKWEDRLRLERFCIAVKKEVINQIGSFDEKFMVGNIDFCIRIRQKGYRLQLCRDTYIHRYWNPQIDVTYELEDEKIFEDKWDFSARYSTIIRHEIISLIEASKNQPISILEVGCACGGTLLQIKNQYKNAKLYGIELNNSAAKIAKTFANVDAENIETGKLSYPEGSFDYIIFADVLEHLYDPWKVLEGMRKYLKPDGKVLASIPNIMHFSVIRNLLNQRWTYEDAGILDKTHVRFFTLDSIRHMVANSGYDLLEIRGTTLIEKEQDSQLINKLCHLNDKNLKLQLQVYQYILKAKSSSVV